MSYFKKPIHVLSIEDSVYTIIDKGMEEVVESGTAAASKIAGVSMCGKTGTVENYKVFNGKRKKMANHGIFTCFAPKINPRIAIAVVIEHSGYGGTWATPIASLLVEKYLKDSLSPASRLNAKRIMNMSIVPYDYIKHEAVSVSKLLD